MRRNYASDNPYIFVAVILIFAGLIFLLYKIKNKKPDVWKLFNSEKFFWIVLIIGAIILFLLQLFVVNGGWFIVGWDTRDVIFPEKQIHSDYMSMYPNQLFLAGLFRRIYLFLTQNLGYTFYEYYYVLVILSVIAVWTSVTLIGLIAKKITGNFCGLVTFLFGAAFLGLSPWIMVPYSDTFAMICTTLTLFCYSWINPKPFKWFFVVFISIIGYFIKPTAIFVLLAILFVEFVKFVTWFIKEKKFDITNKYKLTLTLVTILCALLGLGFSSVLGGKISHYDIEINEDASFTPTHFLMLGVNLENLGAWNNDDVNFTRSFENVEKREEGNIEQWKSRLQAYGPAGISRILLNKTLTNYADGSFSWEAETPWCIENRGTNPVVWFIYGIDPADAHNDNNNYSAYVRQTFWIMTLIGCFLLILEKKPKREEYVICCSLLAISAFLTIFEPDPRYMLLYSPFMLILAPKGWNLGIKKLKTWLKF